VRRCTLCGKEYRKGAIVLVLGQGMGIANVRACQACASKALPIVPAPCDRAHQGEPTPQDFTKKHAAELVAKIVRQLRGLTKGSTYVQNSQTEVREASYHQGKAEAYEGAAALVVRLAEQEGIR
jgi:hypothetical protein